jgi:hypothetical protein
MRLAGHAPQFNQKLNPILHPPAKLHLQPQLPLLLLLLLLTVHCS